MSLADLTTETTMQHMEVLAHINGHEFYCSCVLHVTRQDTQNIWSNHRQHVA